MERTPSPKLARQSSKKVRFQEALVVHDAKNDDTTEKEIVHEESNCVEENLCNDPRQTLPIPDGEQPAEDYAHQCGRVFSLLTHRMFSRWLKWWYNRRRKQPTGQMDSIDYPRPPIIKSKVLPDHAYTRHQPTDIIIKKDCNSGCIPIGDQSAIYDPSSELSRVLNDIRTRQFDALMHQARLFRERDYKISP
ncbi:hypothetical protein DFQ28_005447 [Apophysomyces sp. BC1034]|nr:hypothetical protein DFQ28_005447 [Apophysomyces sp. BC1034]